MRLHRGLRRGARRVRTAWRTASWRARLTVCAVAALVLWAPINLIYQVTQKPSELLAPLGATKTPEETWQNYRQLFRRYATANVAPELLAALAQAESAGNPVARTYWRWRFSLNPLSIYRPASSSVGMYQMTDAAFAEARRSGNGAYWRILPSDAIELTAAYLDRQLAALLAKRRAAVPTQQQKDNLAAVIHLCGPAPAASYLQHGFHLAAGARCGDQDIAAYIARVNGFERRFRRLGQAEAS